MATDTNVEAVNIIPLGGSTNGWQIGFIDSAAKAAADDTLTVDNASAIAMGAFTDDTLGTLDAVTISGNIITLTGAATAVTSGVIVFKPLK